MKKSVKRRAKEAVEKYKPTTDKTNEGQSSPPASNKQLPNQPGGYLPKPDKKRG